MIAKNRSTHTRNRASSHKRKLGELREDNQAEFFYDGNDFVLNTDPITADS